LKKIVFILSHQPNPRFVKQIDYLSKTNQVTVLYFYRTYMKDLTNEYSVDLNICLGVIENGKYLSRIIKYFKSFIKLKKILKKRDYDILIINNIDTLVLFRLATLKKIKVIIEISDLREHTYTNTIKSHTIRFIEKYLFKKIDKLIVTSPKFYELYYKNIFNKEVFILENKPLKNMIPKKLEKIKNKKIRIGIVGLLLQGKPYKTLLDTVKSDNNYEVLIYGRGVYQDLIEEYANQYENIKYYGEYNFFKDISRIYANLDILYMPYDTTNGSLNNKVALPNKFYEALYFYIPIITSKDTYLGELVEKYQVGVTIECCNKKDLIEALLYMNKHILEFQNNFLKIDKSIYIGDKDYNLLEDFICS